MTAEPFFDYDEIDPRRRQLYEGFDRYFTQRCHNAFAERARHWTRDYSDATSYVSSVEPMRARFAAMIGYGGQPECDPEPEWQDIAVTDRYTVRRLWLTVLPGEPGEPGVPGVPGVRMDALYLTPPGDGPWPLVIAQHGLGGTPEECCGFAPEPANPAYSYLRMGARLAERGFAVIAPHMVAGYGTSERGPLGVPELGDADWAWARTQLYRKSYLIGERLIGTEFMCLSRVLDHVAALPEVDAERIGFYGLSQGGLTGLMLPAVEQRIKVSVASAFFQRRLGKMIDYDFPRSPYLKTCEEDRFFAGWLKYFDDADVVSLICPRAFAAETGRQDPAIWPDGSRAAYEEAREHYRKLGIEERIAYFEHDGGHVARGIETFDFIAAQLQL